MKPQLRTRIGNDSSAAKSGPSARDRNIAQPGKPERRHPAAPPVYDPRAARVAQPKAASATSVSRTIAPPVYRPQPVPKVLQTRKRDGHQPAAGTTSGRPVAPPVYRPQPLPKVCQTRTAGNQSQRVTSPNRSQSLPAIQSRSVSKVLQAKEAADLRRQATPFPTAMKIRDGTNGLRMIPEQAGATSVTGRSGPTRKNFSPVMNAHSVRSEQRGHFGRQSGAGEPQTNQNHLARTIQRALQNPKTPPARATLSGEAFVNLSMAMDGDTLIGIMEHNTGDIFLYHVLGAKGKSMPFEGKQHEPLKRPQQGGPAPNHQQVRKIYDEHGQDSNYVGFTVTVHADGAPLAYDWVSRSLNEDFNHAYQVGAKSSRFLDDDLKPGITHEIDNAFQEAARNRSTPYPRNDPPPKKPSSEPPPEPPKKDDDLVFHMLTVNL